MVRLRTKPMRVLREDIMVTMMLLYFLDGVYLISSSPALEEKLDLLQYPILLIMLIWTLSSKIGYKNFLAWCISFAVFALSMLFSGSVTLIKNMLILVFAEKCDIKALYKKLFSCYAVTIISVFILGLLGILPSTTVRRGYATFGFSHSNMFAANVFSLLCCYVISLQRKLTAKHYCILLLAICATWVLTDSRTSVLTMVGFVLVLFFVEKFERFILRGSLLYRLILCLPFILLFLSVWCGLSYRTGSTFILKLDELLSKRIYLADNFMQVITPQWWGQRVNIHLVENTYLVTLYVAGIIPTLLMCILASVALKRYMDAHSAGLTAAMIGFLIHGLTETTAFNPFMNVALLGVFMKFPQGECRKR